MRRSRATHDNSPGRDPTVHSRNGGTETENTTHIRNAFDFRPTCLARNVVREGFADRHIGGKL